jgi:hypothetical protein
MDELSGPFPESMRYDISLDTTLAITAGIDEIVETLFIALALVILVVFIFIQDWRATLIPTIAIPVSLLGAFMRLSPDRLYHQRPVAAGPGAGHRHRGGRRHRGGGGGPGQHRKGMNPRRPPSCHEGGDRPGHRHHPGAGGGLHPGGRHGRHHRPALSAVCHHRGGLGGFFLASTP